MSAEPKGGRTGSPYDDPDLISRQQAADLLHCGLRSLHYQRKAGKFPPGTVVVFRRGSGGHPLVRYRKTKLEEFIANDWTAVSDEPSGSTSAEQK